MYKAKAFVVSIVLTTTATTAIAGGIPVIDSVSIADREAQHVETIAKWVTQYKQMVSQIDQLQAQYNAITGSRGFGQVFNDPAYRDYLPSDWQEIYDKVEDGGYAGLTGTSKDIYKANQLFDSCAHFTVEEQRIECEARAVRPSQDKAVALEAFSKAKARLGQIDQLMAKIDLTTDPKEIAELQGRIALEQAMISNEQTKLKLYSMVADAEKRIQRQRRKEFDAKSNANREWVQPEKIEW